MPETAEARLKRLKMRSWRRGMKEMDLILGPYADRYLAEMGAVDLENYDQLLDENDQELYRWITGQGTPPDALTGLLEKIAAHAGTC